MSIQRSAFPSCQNNRDALNWDARDEAATWASRSFIDVVAPVRKPQLAPRPPSRVGGGGIRSPSTVTVERIKLLANYFNTIAAGLLTAGMIGPMAAYLYGF
jgi:hypothetical protein